ncbi:hypothetical protein AAKU64_002999 [Undibacterium sp. GrIS 1.8]|uniref:DUF1569 domain-containing protein n=1 Tax=unclassified Undibacterium TaxID=2630295 RepID=UPI0033949588
MKKRTLLVSAVALTAVAAAGFASYRKSTVEITSITNMLTQLEALKSRDLAAKLVQKTGWAPYKVFVHLAQSIQYSMTGYPEMKPELFQHTAGSAAFYAFSVAGAMRHNLTEPIPGAPAIADTGNVSEAIDLVIKALQEFQSYTGELRPHFAYGLLSKTEFANAHVMHIENHLKEIQS